MPELPKKLETNKFPQYLCKICGKCCKSITTNHTHEKLQKMAADGSESARVFIDIFKPFASIEEAKKVVPDQIDQILAELAQAEGFDINEITFYYCPHVNEENKCGIYETRPECCRRAPVHGWSCMPPGCGFEGWQFEEREKIKQKIRKIKEYYIAAEATAENGMVADKDMSVEELGKLVEAKLRPYEKYGSIFW